MVAVKEAKKSLKPVEAKAAVPEPAPKKKTYPLITKPGFYDGMPDDIYHGMPCADPSLSSSGAREIVDNCPKGFWARSPMNPDYERKQNKNFDFGHALHLIFLEPDRFEAGVQEIEFDDYRKNEAKLARQAAYDEDKIPLLTEDMKKVWRMREALREHPIACRAFGKGVAERSYFHKDKETGVWLKARPDWEMLELPIVNDYKTTKSANPKDFPKSILQYGYFVQQPFYTDIIKEVSGRDISEWYFIAQEKEEPFLVSVIELKPEAIEYGRQIARAGIRKFADCLASGKWPGYRDPNRPDQDGVITLDLPAYAYFQQAEREERGEFDDDEETEE